MLTEPRIRYAVALATPRDTHSLLPAVTRSERLAPRSLRLPESDQRIRPAGAWSEPERRDWLASRLAARRATAALVRRTGEPPGEIEIVADRAPGAAPGGVVAQRVAARTATHRIVMPLSLSLSIAHSNGHAIAAATSHPDRVGVDLEREGRITSSHAGYFLCARERKERRLTLTEMWALKESAWKALGCSDGTAFADLELLFGSSGTLSAIRLDAMAIPVSAELRRPWPGWVAAVVALRGITT